MLFKYGVYLNASERHIVLHIKLICVHVDNVCYNKCELEATLAGVKVQIYVEELPRSGRGQARNDQNG